MPLAEWSKPNWEGFGSRNFLTDEEFRTYRRRPPVRFPRRMYPVRKGARCSVCHAGERDGNSLQLAHRIPFIRGVYELGLTPESLDSPRNLAIAHKKGCNKKAELSLLDSLRMLRSWGVTEIPAYVAQSIQTAWRSVLNEQTGTDVSLKVELD